MYYSTLVNIQRKVLSGRTTLIDLLSISLSLLGYIRRTVCKKGACGHAHVMSFVSDVVKKISRCKVFCKLHM